ncbi:hypothetical protein ACWGQ5_11905 [Streptomyces sp. NPDC055722]
MPPVGIQAATVPLQPDTSRPWPMLYEACSTEEQRLALTRDTLADQAKLTAPRVPST